MSEQSPPTTPTATVTLDIESSPEAVWGALVTDEGLAAWMGEGATAGAEPGATIVAPDVVTGRPRRGYVGAVEECQRLDYTWWAEDDPDAATNVTITLEPCETGTRVTVVETQPAASTQSQARVGALANASWAWRMALLSVAATVVCVSRVS